MKTLFRSVRRGLSAGEPLPAPWPIFEQKKITFRRSSIQMIAGPPGSMKTVMMLNIVDKMGPVVPTLYHSSDSDDFTMATRVLSMKTGLTTEESEEIIMAGEQTHSDGLRSFGHRRRAIHAGPRRGETLMK